MQTSCVMLFQAIESSWGSDSWRRTLAFSVLGFLGGFGLQLQGEGLLRSGSSDGLRQRLGFRSIGFIVWGLEGHHFL